MWRRFARNREVVAEKNKLLKHSYGTAEGEFVTMKIRSIEIHSSINWKFLKSNT